MSLPPFDSQYFTELLTELLAIPSPSGYTDRIVHRVGEELQRLGIPFELTRRGAIRAKIDGAETKPERAIVAHLDTLGAMVTKLKPNGRLRVSPVGHWSSRFAEGARVCIISDERIYRGTVLPLKASGHIYNEEVDTQPVNWDQVEVRVDQPVHSLEDLQGLGIEPGDFVTFDSVPEFTDGFINARHLDDKIGVAALLALARDIKQFNIVPAENTYFLFTIFEEVGSGASSVLQGDVSEMVAIDNATNSPEAASSEYGVTIAMGDMTGPFDYHLTHKLVDLAKNFNIEHSRDVFRHYRCDVASAVEAGNDLRTGLLCFAVDASHGYERSHIKSVEALHQLMAAYIASPPTFKRDRREMGPLKGFPQQPAIHGGPVLK
ncbi:MAG: osmoprotectant NAGGN system M42 family peptidase [Verrucomicrobia bacterium]|nr:osmoprotectant NAGGN system M42 family peptidase [Verrucomicrobiota bacterium]MCH8527782.1 osmoprotectant NAGGN system M42 family peptidase [Kiritimatiellia bacterium]